MKETIENINQIDDRIKNLQKWDQEWCASNNFQRSQEDLLVTLSMGPIQISALNFWDSNVLYRGVKLDTKQKNIWRSQIHRSWSHQDFNDFKKNIVTEESYDSPDVLQTLPWREH